MRVFQKEFGLAASVVLAIILIFGAFFCSGCEFFRKIEKSSDKKEDTKAVDSGFVKKNEIDNKKSSEWEKTTFIPVFNKDTTINNFYIPESKASQPYIIIQEKGKADEQTKQSGVDSGWFKRIEQQLALATAKKEEVKGGLFTTGQLIVLSIIALIFIVGVFVVVKFANNLTSITALLKQK